MWPLNKNKKEKTALILSGGGARAAYQVGVIKAISEILPKKASNPFDVISGTSAGAINAAVLATRADSFHYAASSMTHVWRNFTTDQIYNADFKGILGNVWKMSRAMRNKNSEHGSTNALLDNSPLRGMLSKVIPLGNIQNAIDSGLLSALCINASEYGTGQSISFYQGIKTLENWQRSGRKGIAQNITLDHLIASSSIPFLFPAQKINNAYYCDGAVRQTSPISPALHLGATKVMVIGVKEKQANRSLSTLDQAPSLAQSAGHILNSVFIDSLAGDIERVERINNTINLIPKNKRQGSGLNKIDLLAIEPSEPIDKIASEHWDDLPATLRLALNKNSQEDKKQSVILSYLLFERAYCRELIELGYKDALNLDIKIKDFFTSQK